jgi:hypothetical protein
MNRREELQEQYEDALFALLMEDMIEEDGKRLLEENERLKQDPDADVPDEVNQRCIRTIKRGFAKNQRRTVRKVTLRVLNKVAVAAVVCALLFVTACAASPELRVKTLNLLIEVSDVATTLKLSDDQGTTGETGGNASDTAGQTLFGYRLPKMPEGFSLDFTNDFPSVADIQYSNNTGATIYISIEKAVGGGLDVDTEDAGVENVTVHGYEGLLIEKQYHIDDDVTINSIMIVWGDTDENTFVTVACTDLDIETVWQLASGIEFAG